MALTFSLTVGAAPMYVSVFPSHEAEYRSLYMTLPSLFHVTSRALAPLFAITQVQPDGQIGPVAGWSLPSNLAVQVPFSSAKVSVKPSGPLEAIFIVPGEPIFTFFVFHLPAKPAAPETR